MTTPNGVFLNYGMTGDADGRQFNYTPTGLEPAHPAQFFTPDGQDADVLVFTKELYFGVGGEA